MKLSEIWETYDAYTKATSEAVRGVAFAGIAAIWVFKVDSENSIHLDYALLVAGIAFVIALAADVTQYAVGTIIFHILGNIRQKKSGAAAQDADYRYCVNWPTDLFFVTKVVAVAVGYFYLLCYLSTKLA